VSLFRRRRKQPAPLESPAPAHPDDLGIGLSDASPLPSYLVDAHTMTFWKRGAPRSETLVETGAATRTDRVGPRVAELVALRDRPAPQRGRRDDPAFVEALMVELLRAGRFERAYELLAPACRQRWGSAQAFAAASAGDAGTLAGVEVRAVRHLDDWVDEEQGMLHRDVAELEVTYHIRSGDGTFPVRRVVHQVRDRDGWRSLLFPPPLPSPHRDAR
jgi:hypothetical protein